MITSSETKAKAKRFAEAVEEIQALVFSALMNHKTSIALRKKEQKCLQA